MYLLFAKSSNFLRAPKVWTPISRKSCSVKVAKVWRSTSCLTNKSVYFANPWEQIQTLGEGEEHFFFYFSRCFVAQQTSLVKTVGRSSVGKMTPTLLGGWLLFNFEPFKRASKALELPNQGDALVPLNIALSPSSVTSAGKMFCQIRWKL